MVRRFFKLFANGKDKDHINYIDFRKACVSINKATTLYEMEELFAMIADQKEDFDQEDLVQFCEVYWGKEI